MWVHWTHSVLRWTLTKCPKSCLLTNSYFLGHFATQIRTRPRGAGTSPYQSEPSANTSRARRTSRPPRCRSWARRPRPWRCSRRSRASELGESRDHRGRARTREARVARSTFHQNTTVYPFRKKKRTKKKNYHRLFRSPSQIRSRPVIGPESRSGEFRKIKYFS